jgi:hypothetical protein
MQTNNHIIIEINHCRYYKDLCRKIARRDLVDDLYQEFIFSLLTYDNLSEVYQKEWFRQFAKKIINNLYHSQTSTFYLKYRHTDKTVKYLSGTPMAWVETPDGFIEDETDILNFINKELDKMDWYDRELFRAAVKLNSERKLAQKTRINRNSIRTTIKKVKERIRNNPQLAQFLYR